MRMARQVGRGCEILQMRAKVNSLMWQLPVTIYVWAFLADSSFTGETLEGNIQLETMALCSVGPVSCQ